MMTKRDNEIYKAAREHSDNRDNRMSFGCGARWADEHEIEFLQSLMFYATYYIFDRINERIKLLKGE